MGESLVDIVVGADGSEAERPGGSAANAAVALARLDRPVRFATSYGDDDRGAAIADHLAADAVVLAGDPHVVPRTSTAVARIGADGAATYDFDVAWRLGAVTADDPHVVHVCSLAPVLEPGADAVLSLVDRFADRATVSYDINLRPAITGVGPEVHERVRRMVARADLVKASDEDLLALWPDRDIGESAADLLALGPAAVVVTRGGEGASWHVGSPGAWSTGGVHAPAVEVVDTIGAGDTFGAGLLDALWEHLGAGGRDRLAALDADAWNAAVSHAVRCAAVTVGRLGADPPRRADLEIAAG